MAFQKDLDRQWGGWAFQAGISLGRGPEAQRPGGARHVLQSVVCGGWGGNETREIGRGQIMKGLECLSLEALGSKG